MIPQRNALPPTCFARPKKSHRPTGERKRKNGVILFNGKLTNTTRPDERASLGGKETERLGEIQHSTRLSIAQLPSMHIWARNMASCWGGCYGIASFKLTITTHTIVRPLYPLTVQVPRSVPRCKRGHTKSIGCDGGSARVYSVPASIAWPTEGQHTKCSLLFYQLLIKLTTTRLALNDSGKVRECTASLSYASLHPFAAFGGFGGGKRALSLGMVKVCHQS